ncbi:MAG: RNA polymerase factor sigma-54, partial [Planctomycetes bacterium]|nr:RNA polymerase factor sigma-54 [Planctomycetota bacterium]
MAQALSQIPRQLLSQQQRLTPQLIQAMDILQLNALALESRIAQEIDGNPALEIVPGDDESPSPPESPAPAETGRSENEQAMVVAAGDARDFERLDSLSREYEFFEEESEYRGTRSRAAISEEGDVKMDAMANTAARPISLRESLLEQWALLDLDAGTRRLGEAVIDHVDETGRVSAPLEQIAAVLEPPASVAAVKDALARVQQLEPPGVAARTLQECLLLQLEALPADTELERAIIENHFEDLQKNRLPQITKALGVELDDVKLAIQAISRLSLHPGADADARDAAIVVPDLIVEYIEDQDTYEVRLTRTNNRELRISEEFREALEKTKGDKSAREFMKQKIEAAAAIIDAVSYRRDRLLDVAKAVIEAQKDFLDQGEQHMKVLRMSDLADRFGCDPSTISRTVDEKWIQTPRGVYPLRRFFTGGTESASGEILGWDSIKAKVHEIVQAEDKREPLSDDE